MFHQGRGTEEGYDPTCPGLHTDLSIHTHTHSHAHAHTHTHTLHVLLQSNTHLSSQTAGGIDAFKWSATQSRARSQCVCVCVCVRVRICVRVWNPGFSPHGTHTNTLPIFPLSFTFKGSTRSAVNHPLSQSRPFILSLFIDQGWFKCTYVM